MTKQELLPVLDMSGDEQWDWVRDYAYEHTTEKIWQTYLAGTHSLEILAFRLRDEAVKSSHADFHEAIYDIMMKVEGNDNWATAFWGECIAKPIHWIIASLIALESK